MKVVIFDFDDTLTDNRILDYESFKYLGDTFGIYTPTQKEIRTMRSKALLAKDIILWMVEKSKKDISLEFCIRERKDFLKRENVNLIKLKPKTRLLLKELKSKGYIILIASLRKDKEDILRFLDRYKITKFFFGVYVNHFETEDKLEIYKEILHDLKVSPNDCLVVGDKPQDLLPSLKLRMDWFRVKNPYETLGKIKLPEFSDLFLYLEKKEKYLYEKDKNGFSRTCRRTPKSS